MDVGVTQRPGFVAAACIVERAALTVYMQVASFGHREQVRIMTEFILRRWFNRFLPVLCCIGMLACAGAPVQEMSNARQAISAARAAGAARIAPQKLTEAQTLLEAAEASLQQRAYRDARRSAVSARSKAAEALGASQAMADRSS